MTEMINYMPEKLILGGKHRNKQHEEDRMTINWNEENKSSGQDCLYRELVNVTRNYNSVNMENIPDG